jgi:hypothetical protein
LTGATLKQSNSLAVYLYDTTRATKEIPPQYLGGEELPKQDTVVDVYSDTV